MLMYFHQRLKEIVLWREWIPQNNGEYAGTFIAIVMFGLTSVALKSWRSGLSMWWAHCEVVQGMDREFAAHFPAAVSVDGPGSDDTALVCDGEIVCRVCAERGEAGSRLKVAWNWRRHTQYMLPPPARELAQPTRTARHVSLTLMSFSEVSDSVSLSLQFLKGDCGGRGGFANDGEPCHLGSRPRSCYNSVYSNMTLHIQPCTHTLTQCRRSSSTWTRRTRRMSNAWQGRCGG